MRRTIGKIVYMLREKEGITQKELSEGFMSVAELSRVEKGERDEDRFVLAALFERLGKSIDKFEVLQNAEEYQIFCLRRLIEKKLLEGKSETVAVLLQEYKECCGKKRSIHKQYYHQMRALNYYLVDKNQEECVTELCKALYITKSTWKWEQENWESVYFCTQEIQIVLMLGCILMEKGEVKSALHILEKIALYVVNHCTDEEERCRVYVKCSWLLSEIYFRKGKLEKAYEICKRGKECLVQNGSLLLMDKLLAVEQKCLQVREMEWEEKNIRQQLEAINFLHRLAKHNVVMEKVILLLLTDVKSEMLVCNEMLYEIRNAYGFSQEELSWEICSRETLSRIENGKRSPNRKKLQAMFKKIGEGRDSYYGYVVTDDYRIYEKVNLYKSCYYKKKREEAYALLGALEQELDLSNPVNRQFIENNRIIEKMDKKEIGYEQAVEDLTKTLRITMKKFDGTVYRVPYREEFVILNCMAICLRYSGKREEAEQLYGQLLEKYRKSQVEEIHHIVPLSLLYVNYIGLLEVNNKLDKAEEIGKQGMKLIVEGQCGDVAGKLLANLSCVYEKKNTVDGKIICETYLRQSYRLLKLFHLSKDATVIKTAYEEKYNKILE